MLWERKTNERKLKLSLSKVASAISASPKVAPTSPSPLPPSLPISEILSSANRISAYKEGSNKPFIPVE